MWPRQAAAQEIPQQRQRDRQICNNNYKTERYSQAIIPNRAEAIALQGFFTIALCLRRRKKGSNQPEQAVNYK
jgi:hypothetical protein